MIPRLYGRLPHGRRGLKFRLPRRFFTPLESPSTRKAWIEINNTVDNLGVVVVAFHTEGVD